MFENTPFPGAQPNPLNPPMSAPSLTPPGSLPPTPSPAPAGMPQPSVHTMPERFRTSGGGTGGAPGSKSTKKLVIILVVVLIVAGLGVAGLVVFQRINQNANENANLNTSVVVTNLNTANENANINPVNENINVVVANTNTGIENTNAGNTNSEVNSNINANTDTDTGTTGSPLPSSADTDNDGLTDVEEGVYGTDITKPDSDSDSFLDGKQIRSDGTVIGEVYNGFNPLGPGKLEESTLVKRQENANKEYNLLVPSQWTSTADASGGLFIVPSQQTGESIQIRINDNPNRLSPKEWYKSISPNSNTDSMTVISVNGLEALYTEDLSTIYFFKDTKVYSLQYQTGSLTQVNFRTTIDMMVRSFTLGAAS